MLRGRLDGADRLITAILPDSDPQTVQVREMLIREAQAAIAKEWETFERELQNPPPTERRSFFRRNLNMVVRVVTPRLSWRRDSKMEGASRETETEGTVQTPVSYTHLDFESDAEEVAADEQGHGSAFRKPGDAATLPELIRFLLDRTGYIDVYKRQGLNRAEHSAFQEN